MSFTIGHALKLTIFGESHGQLVGGTLDGLPSGVRILEDEIKQWMALRKPSQSFATSQRKEEDLVEVVSGIEDGYSNGGPITIIIRNRDAIRGHYDELKDRPRPGHADLTSYYRYGEHRSYSGGGFLSGRLTAPMVALGSIAFGLMERKGIRIISVVDSIGDIVSDKTPDDPMGAYSYPTRIPDQAQDLRAQALIRDLLGSGDSVGGSVRTTVKAFPEGIGEPLFDSLESLVSHAMFSIPAVKGLEFGAGFRFTAMKGSEANDQYEVSGERIVSATNHNGGILGGISNGMDINFRVAVKPTSSIKIPQKTVDLRTREQVSISVIGRHDPCIAIRALPVVQTMTAFVLADVLLMSGVKLLGSSQT